MVEIIDKVIFIKHYITSKLISFPFKDAGLVPKPELCVP